MAEEQTTEEQTTLTGELEDKQQIVVGDRAFIFDTVTSEEWKMSADITDQFVEDNSTIQDHIAIKPEELTLKGFVAEKVYRQEDNFTLDEELNKKQKEAKIQKSLDEITGNICPVFSNYFNVYLGVRAYVEDTWSKLKTSYNSAKDFIQKNNEKTLDSVRVYKDKTDTEEYLNQLQVSNMLQDHMKNRKPVQWKNAYGVFENYYITSFTLSQSDSKYLSELTISLKKLRFASTTTSEIDYSTYEDKYGLQQQELDKLGEQQGNYELMSLKYKEEHGIK